MLNACYCLSQHRNVELFQEGGGSPSRHQTWPVSHAWREVVRGISGQGPGEAGRAAEQRCAPPWERGIFCLEETPRPGETPLS